MPLKPFKRIIHGDLRETYEQLVSNAPESEERGEMMAVMNVMCGNVEIECAFAVLKARETKEQIDQRRDQHERPKKKRPKKKRPKKKRPKKRPKKKKRPTLEGTNTRDQTRERQIGKS